MIIEPKIRNNICLTAHPAGCAEETKRQIAYVKKQPPIEGCRKALIIGSSTGYGLASRIAAAFGGGADTIGVFLEKEGSERRPGTPGFYNSRTFDEEARKAGLFSLSINGDAFSHQTRAETLAAVKEHLGPVDLVIYSLASPVRKDPDTQVLYKSALKPIGTPYTAKALDAMKGLISEVSLEPATEEEIANTVKVMGGEDWKLWIEALKKENLLADGVKTMAYSYIGPEVTHPIYRAGTIGKAKEDLEKTAGELTAALGDLNGAAWVSVNKALVTKAAAVIPAVSLYIALLFKVMKEKDLHEGCIEQMYRLFSQRLFTGSLPETDKQGRIRVDDWEMRADVQEAVAKLWNLASTENIEEISDLSGYRLDFLQMHGFSVPGVDYSAEVSTL